MLTCMNEKLIVVSYMSVRAYPNLEVTNNIRNNVLHYLIVREFYSMFGEIDTTVQINKMLCIS